MKKLFTLLTMLIVAISASWATDVTINPMLQNSSTVDAGVFTFEGKDMDGTDFKFASKTYQIAKNKTGNFVVTSTKANCYIKSVTFTDSNNKTGTVTAVTSDAEVTASSTSGATIAAKSGKQLSSVEFSVAASGGTAKVATISVVVDNQSSDGIEAMYKFTGKTDGVITCTHSPSSDITLGGDATNSSDRVNWGNNKTLTITSASKFIKAVYLQYDAAIATDKATASTGSYVGTDATYCGTWTVGDTKTQTVTLTNKVGGTRYAMHVVVITEEITPETATFSPTSGDAEQGATINVTSNYATDIYYAWTDTESEPATPANWEHVTATSNVGAVPVPGDVTGTYYLYAYGKRGEVSGTIAHATYTIVAPKTPSEVSFGTPTTTVEIGESVTNVATISAGGSPVVGTVTYASDNTDVATVDENTGEVTGVAAGSAKITATFAGNSTYSPSSANYTINVPIAIVDNKFWTSGDMLTAVGGSNTDINNSRVIDNLELVGTTTALKVTTGGNKTIDGQTVGGRVRFGKDATADGNYVHFRVAPNSQITIWGIRAGDTAMENGLALSFGAVGEDEQVYSFAGGDVEYLNYNYTGAEATDVYAYSKATAGASMMAIKVAPIQSNDITVGETGFATIGFPYATTLPTGVTGYAVTAVSGGKVTVSDAIVAGTEIPANTGLIITAAKGDYTFTSVGAASAIGTNKLEAVGATAKAATSEAPIYVFAKLSDTKVGFKKATSGSLGAYKAYLPGNISTQNTLSLSFEDEATAINGVAEEASDAAPVKVLTAKGVQIGKFNVAGQQVK